MSTNAARYDGEIRTIRQRLDHKARLSHPLQVACNSFVARKRPRVAAKSTGCSGRSGDGFLRQILSTIHPHVAERGSTAALKCHEALGAVDSQSRLDSDRVGGDDGEGHVRFR